MGAESNLERRQLREVFQRSLDCGVRKRDLEGGTMPSSLETQSPPGERISPLAGKTAPKEILVDVARLEKEYFERRPDVDDPNQRVSFGTSGHRGSPLRGTFNEAHILAITPAICEYRHQQGTGGPLFMRKDTHAVSQAAHRTALAGL